MEHTLLPILLFRSVASALVKGRPRSPQPGGELIQGIRCLPGWEVVIPPEPNAELPEKGRRACPPAHPSRGDLVDRSGSPG